MFSEPSPLLLTILLFGVVFALMTIGMPVTFCFGVTGVAFAILFMPPAKLYLIPISMYGAVTSPILMAVPAFIFMGNILVYTGIAKEFFSAIYQWLPVRGSLAVISEIIGAGFASICGGSVPTTLAIGNIALPEMLRRGYDKNLALGSVGTAGLLGIMIPPSTIAIIYCAITGVSVGMVYAALIIPGFLLAVLYIIYILVRCWIQPELGPTIPKEERLPLKGKVFALKGILIPIFIILAMLIGMYSGVVTPTEASGAGAAMVFLFGLIRKELTPRKLRDACINSVKVAAMVIWIMMTVNVFSQVYFLLGAGDIITQLASELPGEGILVVIIMQIVIFMLGTAMDDTVVILLLAPIFVPVIVSLGLSPVWFAVLFLLQVNISWISPPFGYTLIVLKAISPPNVTMLDIWRAVMPFMAIQLVFLMIVLFLPGLVMWLPNLIIGK